MDTAAGVHRRSTSALVHYVHIAGKRATFGRAQKLNLDESFSHLFADWEISIPFPK
jgi:hypothetical protein